MGIKLLLKVTRFCSSMKVKFLIILMILECFSGPLMADVVMSKGWACGSGSYHETWYLGTNEEVFHYHKNGGGKVDDGLFVAIPDVGRHGKHSYYELRLPFMGKVDGGPAYLPDDPSNLAVSAYYCIAKGHDGGHRNGFRTTIRGDVPELSDGSMIPIGSKFFYWMSRGGSFSLPTTLLESVILLEKEQTVEEVLISDPETTVNCEEGLEQQTVVDCNEIEDFLKSMDESGEIDDN